MDKPMRVEVGQRWKYLSDSYTVVAKNEFGWRVSWASSGQETIHPDDSILRDTYLGPSLAPPPVPERPRPQVGQRWRDTKTGPELFNRGEPFALTRRYPHDPSLGWCYTPGSDMYWPDYCFEANGRLEYVDSPPVVSGERAPGHWECNSRDNPPDQGWIECSGGYGKPCDGKTCNQAVIMKMPHRWVPDTSAPKKPEPLGPQPQGVGRPAIPASCQLERWDETGPLSALQSIQARKPPEPWIPSVDEFDLLPDAGTSYSGRGR